MSTSGDSADEDLRDVFRLLYADEDWDESDANEADEQPDLNTLIPEIEIERVETAIEPDFPYSQKYTRKRLHSALTSLLFPSPAKRPRIYPPSAPPPPSIYLSALSPPPLPASTTFDPFTPLALLSRLLTFSPSTTSLLPATLAPLVLASQGWIPTAKQRVGCGACRAEVDLRGLGGIADERIKREVGRRIAVGLRDRHEAGCGWRMGGCEEDVYDRVRTTLHPMLSDSVGPLASRLEQDCLAGRQLRWTSPVDEKHLLNLQSRLLNNGFTSLPPSLAAAALALFCWYPLQPPSTPSSPNSLLSIPETSTGPVHTDIVACRICRRRVGLWSFTSRDGEVDEGRARAFDLEEEHLAWCPVRRTGGEDKRAWWEEVGLLKAKAGVERAERGLGIKLSPRLVKRKWRKERERGDTGPH